MFRKTYDSLSTPVHVELLVDADKLCLKTYLETHKGEYDQIKEHESVFKDAWKYDFLGHNNYANQDISIADAKNARLVDRSLTHHTTPSLGEFPPEVQGVYHRYLPCGRLMGQKVMGEEFADKMAEPYKTTYKDKLTGRYFVGNSYSWIDLTDPSISSGEITDGSCWVIGIDNEGYARPAFNATTRERDTKAHPLRSARQFGGPASVFVYQPFKDVPLNECSITLKFNRGYGFSTNLTGFTDGTNEKELFKTSGKDYNYTGQLNEAFPSFEVTSGGGSIASDGVDTVEFKMVDGDGKTISKNTDLYLEATGGYLPKQRVTTKDGVGSFKVKALAMDSGDKFKVKIGFRNFTGMKDVEYTVA